MKKQQGGFTLIELIMVIVILGILAAFALPRFADLGGNARRATIEGAEGAIRSASAIAHSAWLAAGNTPATVNLEGQAIPMVNGYPSAAGILLAAQIVAADYTITTAAPLTTVQATGAVALANCQVTYTEAAAANTAPTITSDVTNC